MGKAFLKNTADLLQKKHKRKQWQKIMISLSLVVALLTSCLLIHPAITMSRQATCGQEEHTHTEKCYEKKLICNKEEQSISESSETEGEESVEAHTHSDACYENVLICGKQEHTHSEACYPKEEEKKETAEADVSKEEKKEEVAANTEEEKSEDKDVKSEDQEDKAEEKTEDTEKAEARTLEVDQADYTVEVDCPAEANIPKDAKLKVREIKKDSDEYQDYYEKAMKAVASGDETDISFARFFDISFEVDGKEIEPEAKVEVKITYDDKVEVPEKGKVKSVHFGNKTEVLDVKTNEKNGKMDEVKFDADSFSVYAIVGTETLTTQYITAEGETFNIAVTIPEDAGVPSGAELQVEEIEEESAHYEASFNKAEAFIGEDLTYGRFFDISIVKNGNKIQPKKPVSVDIQLDNTIALAPGAEISVVHFTEGKTEVISAAASGTEYTAMTDVDQVSFETGSFSEFGLTGSDAFKTVSLKAVGDSRAATVTNATVKAQGANVDEVTIEPGMFEDTANVIPGYIFQQAWYGNINIDGLFYDEEEEIYYGTIDGNVITGVEIDPARVILQYQEGAYTVSYRVTVGGTEQTDYSKMVEVTGSSSIGENGSIKINVVPKTGYSLSTITASNGSISGPGSDGYYTLTGVTENTTITVALTEVTSYRFTFNGSNTTIRYNNQNTNSKASSSTPPLNTTYTAANTISFSLTGRNEWSNKAKVLNQLSITIDDTATAVGIPDSTGAANAVSTTLPSGYVVTVEKTNQVQYPTYNVTIAAPQGEKVRGDIHIQTNFKDYDSSEVWAKQLDGVEPLAYRKRSGNNWTIITADGQGDQNSRLQPEVYTYYSRNTSYASQYFIKLTGEYSADDLYLYVENYRVTQSGSNYVVSKAGDIISRTKVSTLSNIGNTYNVSGYSSTDKYFTIQADGSRRDYDDIRIYIKYEPDPEEKFTVWYDPDGGNVSGSTAAWQEGEGHTLSAEDTICITSIIPTKEGYTFAGWYLAGDPDTVYDAEQLFKISADNADLANADHQYVFKAKWIDQQVAKYAYYTVDIYLETDEEGVYPETANYSTREKGDVGSTAYVIQDKLDEYLREKEQDFDDYYEFDKVESELIVADGSSIMKIYFKKIRYDVTVTKTVEGSAEDKAEIFRFISKIGANGTENTFNLTDGGSKTIRVLRGKNFYIKEDATSAFEVTVDGATADGTDGWYKIENITENKTVNYTNTRSKQLIKIVKAGDNTEGATIAGAEFTLSGTSYGTLTSAADGSVKSGSVEVFELDAGGNYFLTETKAPSYFKGLTGAVEIEATNSGLTIEASTADEANVSLNGPDADGVYTITVTNIRKTADLKITKKVDGLSGDLTSPFEFTISGASSETVTKDLFGDENSDDHFVSYPSIPYGTQLTVTESQNEDFDTTITVNGEEAESVSFTLDDQYVVDGLVDVVFTNTRNKQNVVFEKVDVGHTSTRLAGATFTLTETASGIEYSLTSTDEIFAVNESKTLPVGSYTLHEVTPPEGYVPMSEDIMITVSANGVVSNNGSEYSDGDYEGTLITIYNSSGAQLPMTGGSGTLPYTLGGIALIMASALMYGFRMRRRERRLN